MNNIKVMTLKLLVIAAVAAFVLGVVNAFTSPKIASLEKEAKIAALGELTDVGRSNPDSESIVDGNEYINSFFTIEDSSGLIGYIVNLTGKGYGGAMTIMASYNLDGSIIRAVLMNNGETPGFGKKFENPEIIGVFNGTGSDLNPVPAFTYEVSDSDAVSSATISFMGISKALTAGSDFVKGGAK